MRFIFSLVLFFVANTLFANQTRDCQQQHCMVVVDAGSTGSRVHLYTYSLDDNNEAVNVHEAQVKKIKPGFASLPMEQAAVSAYLQNLFTETKVNGQLPVYFYATGGMRLQPKQEQLQRYALLKQWFAKQNALNLKDARTLSGQEEGRFDWLAVNYELGNLGKDSVDTVGVMDMGGASVQVVFPMTNPEMAQAEDKLAFNLYGRHYTLFSHSFLGLGQTEMMKQFINSPECFANDYKMPEGAMGHGDAMQCEQTVSQAMQSQYRVATRVQAAREGSVVHDWYVLGGVVSMVSGKPYQTVNETFTNQDMLIQGDAMVCRQQWSVLSQQFPDNEYLFGYCFNAAYFYALMVEGYGLGEQQPVHYLSEKQTSDWTLGVVLLPERTSSF